MIEWCFGGQSLLEEMAGAGCRNLENTGCVRAWKEHLREFSEKEAWSKSPVANGFCFLYPREKKDLKDGISLVIARNRRSDIRVMMAAALLRETMESRKLCMVFQKVLERTVSGRNASERKNGL